MLDPILRQVLKRKFNKLYQNQQDPFGSQKRAFEKLKKSGLALDHHGDRRSYSKMTLHDFIRNGVAHSYEYFSKAIDEKVHSPKCKRMFNGPIEFVGLSSGTTGSNSKQIIFNKEMVQSYRDYQSAVASIVLKEANLPITSANRLTWGSSPVVDHTATGVERGYISGWLSASSPKILQRHAFPSPDIARIKDLDQRTLAAAKELRGHQIRLLSGVPSYLINLLEKLKEEWQVQDLSEVWPNVQAMIYSGTPIHAYREELENLLGQSPQAIGIFCATEGPMGYEIPSINNQILSASEIDQKSLYSFHLGETVYSFKNANDESDTRLRGLHELEPGDEVEILTTTPNGLTHYQVGDCLRIHSVQPFVLYEMIGRVGQGLNVATEKVAMSELIATIGRVQQESHLPIRHFFVYPGKGQTNKPCYEWVLVTDNNEAQPREFQQTLAEKLDRCLMEFNGDYKENRTDFDFLDLPKVHMMDSNIVKRYFERDGHRGQLKMKSTFESAGEFHEFLGGLQLKHPGESQVVNERAM